MDAQFYRQILVMGHLNPEDISPHPGSLEIILLPLRQKVVYGVLQLTVVHAVPCGDGLPSSVNYIIAARCSESWSHVPIDHSGPIEDLHDDPELFLPWTRTLLILNSRVVVMPMWPSIAHSLPIGIRARNLPVRTGASFPKDFNLSVS
jgi:hypothetical protein